MPISPEKMKLYPGGSIRSPEWLAKRKFVLKRAGNCCEGSPKYPACRAENSKPHPVTGSIVVLTIAHFDGKLEDHSYENLRAWCQRCHNTHDLPQRMKAAVITRHRKSGQSDLFEGE